MASKAFKRFACAGSILSGLSLPAYAQGVSSDQAADITYAQDIVVTAQRREERLVDVPISITAVTSEKLEATGITSMTDLDRVVPGLVFYTTASHASPTIRGVGSTLTGPGADNPVAIYVDGVYQSAASSLLFDLNNIQQIEVLKGPQGTLFGRNATGGAIRVMTLQPNNDPALRATLSYGRFNDFTAKFYGNVPLVEDKLAFNVAALYRKADNYIHNLFYNKRVRGPENITINPKLRWTPSDATSFTLSGIYSNQKDDKFESFGPYGRRSAAYEANPSFIMPGRNEINQNVRPVWHVKTKGLTFRAEQKAGFGTFSAISGYTDYKGFPLTFDVDFSPANNGSITSTDKDKAFSQELNFTSQSWRNISLVTGLFYYHDKATRIQPFSSGTGAILAGYQSKILTDAYAAFAELTYDATERLHFIVGQRYSYEKKKFNYRNIVTNATGFADANWDGWTPRAVIRFEPSDHDNIYLSWSKGFKSGTFNPSVNPSPATVANAPVSPEKLTAYEIGYKTSRRGFRFNVSAFYNDYTDIQVNIQLAPGIVNYQNAGSAEIYGAEFELGVNLTSEFEVTAGGAWTHGEYKKFLNAPISNGTNSPVTFGDVSGNVTTRTPKFTGNIGATYTHETSSGIFGATVNGAYNSGYYPAPDNRLKSPSYFVVNGEISWTTPDKRFKFAVWGKNITNDTKLLYLAAAQNDVAIYDAPRTYGISLSVNLN
jgi:iron complex outermembrane receptor protein